MDLTSREPFLRSLCLLDWMSREKKTPCVTQYDGIRRCLTQSNVNPIVITIILYIDSAVSYDRWVLPFYSNNLLMGGGGGKKR